MNRSLLLFVLLLTLFGGSLPAVAFPAGSIMRKEFSAPNAHQIFVHTQLVRDEETIYWDFIVIEEKNGSITLTQYPMGQREGIYKLISLNEQEQIVQFSNPDIRQISKVEFARVGEKLVSKISG